MDNFPYNRAGRGQAVLPPAPKAPTAAFDEWGTPYDAQGNSLAEPSSLGVNALTALAAPVNIGLALMGSLSPYDGTEGGEGWRVPPIISEPTAAFARSGESTGFGDDGQFYLPNVQNPQVAQDTLTQLMTVYGGNALGSAFKPKPVQNALVPDGPTFYHGTDRAFSGNFSLEPARQSGESDIALAFSSNPALASGYSGIHSSTRRWQDIGTDGIELSYYGNQSPRVYPVKIDAKNPKIIEQEDWGSRGENGGLMAEAKKQGHDAIFFRYTNPVYGDGGLQEALVWQPGTVRSATTGETLFSDNRPSLMGSALASQSEPYRLRHSTDKFGGVSEVLHGDNSVGRFEYETTPSAVYVKDAWVDPSYRKKGIASRVYGKIQDSTGLPLTPDVALSDDGYAFWKSNYPEAVKNHVRNASDNGWHDPAGYIPDEVPDWRLAGGPGRPDGVLWSDNRPSLLGSALASGQGEARFPTQIPDNVRLERSPNGSNYHLYSGEDMIGGSYVRDLGDNIQIGNISISPEWQRQGLGGALHGIAEQDFGKPAVPDVSLSDAALEFWRKYDPNAVDDYSLTPWGQWSPKR